MMSQRENSRKVGRWGFARACSVLCGMGLLSITSTSALGQAYEKTFYVEGVANGMAPIRAGGVTQTWVTPSGTQTFNARHRIFQGPRPVWGNYRRAVQRTDRDGFVGAGSFPINGNTVGTVAAGWDPARITSNDNHLNTSWADIDVDPLRAAGPVVNVRGRGARALANSVRVEIEGDAQTGPIPHIGTPEAHTADSFASVEVRGTATWKETGAGARPKVKAYTRAVMSGGGWEQGAANPRPRRQGRVRDPIFVTLEDLGGDLSITEEVMTLDLAWRDAEFKIDEHEMRFSIPDFDQDAFVELEFSNVSDWVEDPYEYSIFFNSDRFEIDGLLPEVGLWTKTLEPGRITWSIDLDGTEVFDLTSVVAPDDLVELGHDYTYHIGDADGTYEVRTVVPTPAGSIAVVLGGVLALARRRRH